MEQNVEAALAADDQRKRPSANPLLLSMLASLNDAVVYTPGSGNIQTNARLWNSYSESYDAKPEWLQTMASQVGMEADLQCLGDEWAPREHTLEVIREFILPYLQEGCVVGEIGVGGGRIAREVLGHGRVRELHCFDVSQAMLTRAQGLLRQHSAAATTALSFHLVDAGNQRLRPTDDDDGAGDGGFFDFIYSFDVFPHVELHVIHKYLIEMRRTLKPGARGCFSTSDVTSPGGFARFQAQAHGTVGGFVWTSPEAVLFLVEKAGLAVVTVGARRADNTYLNRDLVVVVERRA